ncbi:MAG: hypothetical protein ACRBDX_02120 [Gammaproteobacteria bacterium]
MMSRFYTNGQFLKFGWLWISLALSLTAPCLASSKFEQNNRLPIHPVEIEISSDNGNNFSIYPVAQQYMKKEYRAYVEAINGENYSIKIRNHSKQRLGLVIAVDGRNIISGKKSILKHNEHMYILEPFETQTYSGWRTSSSDIHRFYFTESENSYAHAFADDSATGVIAVAVFEEKLPLFSRKEKKRSMNKPQAAANDSAAIESSEQEAGTGFGEHAVSHVRRVHFNAKRTALTKNFYKYEWRETLCHKHIIDCGYHHIPEKKNRFWPKDDYEVGYAPHPPARNR